MAVELLLIEQQLAEQKRRLEESAAESSANTAPSPMLYSSFTVQPLIVSGAILTPIARPIYIEEPKASRPSWFARLRSWLRRWFALTREE